MEWSFSRSLSVSHDGNHFGFDISLQPRRVSCDDSVRRHILRDYASRADDGVFADGHAFTNEGMAGDFAVLSDRCVFLDLNKRSNLRVISNFTAIQIDELRKLDSGAQIDIGRNRAKFAHRRTSSPRFWIERSTASSIRTTRRPACPSLKGFLLFKMQSAKYPSSTRSASGCSSWGSHMSPVR